MSKEFLLPDLGEGIAEAQIIRVMIKQGDMITEDQYLMEVETDKAAVEIPSPYSGVASKVHVKEGQTINVGEVIVTFDDSNGSATAETKTTVPKQETVKQPAAAKTSPTPTTPTIPATPVSTPAPVAGTATMVPPRSRKTTAAAAPVVRKLAREMGVDLDSIPGTGPGGRITREDVEAYVGGSTPAAADSPGSPATSMARPITPFPTGPLPGTPDTDKWGAISREPFSQIRKTIAKHMVKSAFTIPHVTHNDEVDVSQLDELRKQVNEATGNNPKLTILSFVIRATCIALKKFPIFNASFDEEGGQIIYKSYVNMGIAVDSQRGLIVPVIRSADQLSLQQIAIKLRGIADSIRANKFTIEDLRGGTFTITNVGALGGSVSTPIINHPEVAILGLGRTCWKPVVRNDEITKGLMLPLNLSFDHRATDGANAARFAGEIIGYLGLPGRFLVGA